LAALSKAAPDSRDLDAWREAIELESRGQYRRARERFTECLNARDVEAGDVHFHLGWCLEADGERSGAMTHYLQAAALATARPVAANATYRAALLALGDADLVQAMRLLERTREASASCVEVRELAPHAAYWLGVCCERDNRVLDALELYDEASRSGEPRLRAEARYRRLQGLASIGAFEAAIRIAEQLIESDDGRDDGVARLAGLAADERLQLLLALKEA
jgi:tetratricopeptide (TPR) repeat protein